MYFPWWADIWGCLWAPANCHFRKAKQEGRICKGAETGWVCKLHFIWGLKIVGSQCGKWHFCKGWTNHPRTKNAILELFFFPALCSIPGAFSLLSAAARGEVLMVNKWGRDSYFPSCQQGLDMEIREQWDNRLSQSLSWVIPKCILRVTLFILSLFEWRGSDGELVSRSMSLL